MFTFLCDIIMGHNHPEWVMDLLMEEVVREGGIRGDVENARMGEINRSLHWQGSRQGHDARSEAHNNGDYSLLEKWANENNWEHRGDEDSDYADI